MLKLNPLALLFKPRRADTAGAVATAPDLAMWRLPFLASSGAILQLSHSLAPMSQHETAIAEEMALTNLKTEPYHQFRPLYTFCSSTNGRRRLSLHALQACGDVQVGQAVETRAAA